MRRRRLKKLIKRLHELRQQKLTRDQLLIKLGAGRKEAGPAAWRIIDLQLPDRDQAVTPETFGFRLNWQRLREARRREGSYLLRSNVTGSDPAHLCRVPGLLSAGDAETTTAIPGAGTDAEVGAGEDGGDPDGRCASADDGR